LSRTGSDEAGWLARKRDKRAFLPPIGRQLLGRLRLHDGVGEKMEDLMQANHGVVEVFYIPTDGLHFFVGASENSKGLCVAHPDLRVAFDETTLALNALSELSGKNIKFAPEATFEEFRDQVEVLKPQKADSNTKIKLSGKAQMVWQENMVAA